MVEHVYVYSSRKMDLMRFASVFMEEQDKTDVAKCQLSTYFQNLVYDSFSFLKHDERCCTEIQ